MSSVLGVSVAIIAYASPVLSQTSDLSFAGSWVGGLETAGEFAFYSATVNDDARTGTGSVLMRDLSGDLRVITEGTRVQITGLGSVVLSGTLSGDEISAISRRRVAEPKARSG